MPPGGCQFRTSPARDRRRRRDVGLDLCALIASPGARGAHRGRATAGEAGTGEPALPVVYPRTRTQLDRALTRHAGVEGFVGHLRRSLRVRVGRNQIRWVAKANSWMLDFAPNPNGTYNFRPGATETRKYFARSVVRAFAPGEKPDGSIVFSDVDASTSWYRWARSRCSTDG